MSKTALGKKHHCKSCGAKFYDLGRELTACAICGEPLKGKAPAKPPPPPPPPPPPVEPEVAETIAVETPKADGVEPEFISLEEAEAAESGGDGGPEIEDEEALGELDDVVVGVEVSDDDADDTFLENDDEDEPDVEDIIGASVKSED